VYTGVTDKSFPLTVAIEGMDDAIYVANRGVKELIILDYLSEPYVRMTGGRVFVNTNSQAYYINQDRYAAVKIPEGVGKGKPKWEEVPNPPGLDGYSWHDHRIHWMAKTPPSHVDANSSKRQKVFDWTIPVTYDGKEGNLTGTLYYVGGKDTVEWWQVLAWYKVAGAVFAFAVALVLLVLASRKF
jgi:hypothetical protein